MDDKKFLEAMDQHFNVTEDESGIELETWTDGGVNMFVFIRKDSDASYLEQFKEHIAEFNVDNEIDTHRQEALYRNDFTITESLADFTAYKEKLTSILSDVEETKKEKKPLKKAVVIMTYEDEADLNTFLSRNGTYAEISAVYEDLDAADIEHLEDIIHQDIVKEEV